MASNASGMLEMLGVREGGDAHSLSLREPLFLEGRGSYGFS